LKQPIRIGFGYDVHAFSEGRKLILGGVEIPFEKGLLGHSDADVLLHAICDAILGALALGDIGSHFPDTDENYKNADSRILLERSYSLIKDSAYRIGNLDCTVVMERPKLAPYINDMREVISGLFECSVDQISVKATTSEKLGFVGNEEGVKAYAVALLLKEES
jgi:2-C-methyl-D-erythritol 2,4-cyclodiphosphate synthase